MMIHSCIEKISINVYLKHNVQKKMAVSKTTDVSNARLSEVASEFDMLFDTALITLQMGRLKTVSKAGF